MANSSFRSAGLKVKATVNRDNIELKLQELGPAIVRGAFMHAFNKVGKYWRELIKSKLPVGKDKDYDGGDLRDSIVSRARIGKNPLTKKGAVAGGVTVRPNARKQRSDGKTKSYTPAEYAVPVEFGLKTRDYPAHPVWRPVFDSTEQIVQQMFADTLNDHLQEAVDEVRAKYR